MFEDVCATELSVIRISRHEDRPKAAWVFAKDFLKATLGFRGLFQEKILWALAEAKQLMPTGGLDSQFRLHKCNMHVYTYLYIDIGSRIRRGPGSPTFMYIFPQTVYCGVLS